MEYPFITHVIAHNVEFPSAIKVAFVGKMTAHVQECSIDSVVQYNL